MSEPALLSRPVRLFWYAALGATLAAWTWRKWPDPIVDFGRELYTPWRLSEGDILGRDVATLFGPLSQLFNGLLFKVFGASFSTLIIANLVLLAVLVVVVDDFFSRVVSSLAALSASTVLLTVFAFSQYTTFGNNNFIAPYAHEATHGMILCLLMVWSLTRWVERPDRFAWVWIAGVACGLAQLTKPEPALSAVVGAVVVVALVRRSGQRVAGALLRFAAGIILPLAACLGWFLRTASLGDAMRVTFGAWLTLASGSAGGLYYRATMGLDHPLSNVGKMVAAAVVFAAIFGAGIAADRSGVLKGNRRWLAFVPAVLLGWVLTRRGLFDPWMGVGRPLPLLMLLALRVLVARIWRARESAAKHDIALAAWAAVALAALGKIALNSHLYGYGFTLAMPATLLVTVAIVDLIPTTFAPGAVTLTRLCGAALVASLAIVHLQWSGRQYAAKGLTIGNGGDAFIALDESHTLKTRAFSDTLTLVESITPADGTVAVLPEGVMLNYLTRRRTPTRYLNFMPPELIAFGEPSVVAAMEKTPPAVVVIIHKDTSEYGLGPFGKDPRYGQQIMHWVDQHYEPVETFLAQPFVSNRFGIQVLKRRAANGG